MSRGGVAVGVLSVLLRWIGWIDLPMPWKTHCLGGRGMFRSQSFELLRRPVAQGRGQPLTVVILIDKFLHIHLQFPDVGVFSAVNLFVLQSLHEAFARSIVVRICRAAHTRCDVVALEQFHVFPRGILNATVRVM